ncbi:alanine racemase [Puniceibacterium antarcticum]|uniref:alanine racemase n=1 Tax=Puniceibacterium antarcticum TaxID=1206336 RepID=UPI0015D4F1E3|nr:alanine racemase [Puniceibacterium antarcticum]
MALLENVEIVRKRIGQRGLCAVLKGDAYGHGIDIVAPEIIRFCSHVAVVDNQEIEAVRRIDENIPLIRLRVGSEGEISDAAKADWRVREMAASFNKIEEIGKIYSHFGQTADIHLSLDAAGLGRNGFSIRDPYSLDALMRTILTIPNTRVASVGCHLPDAGSAVPYHSADPSTRALNGFVATVKWILQIFVDHGLPLPEISSYSSSSSCAFGEHDPVAVLGLPMFDRIGSSLLGLTSSNRHGELGTGQVLHAGTFVCDVTHREHGETVGYEHSYKIEDPEGKDIAILGVGWLTLSRYQQGLGKTTTPAHCMTPSGDIHEFLGRQSMNISTVSARSRDGRDLRPGEFIYLTTDFGPDEYSPTIPRVAKWMGGVQHEFVSTAFGASSSTSRFLF